MYFTVCSSPCVVHCASAVHQMGYGSRALQLLQMYYEGKFPTMDESAHANNSEITSVSSEVTPLVCSDTRTH